MAAEATDISNAIELEGNTITEFHSQVVQIIGRMGDAIKAIQPENVEVDKNTTLSDTDATTPATDENVTEPVSDVDLFPSDPKPTAGSDADVAAPVLDPEAIAPVCNADVNSPVLDAEIITPASDAGVLASVSVPSEAQLQTMVEENRKKAPVEKQKETAALVEDSVVEPLPSERHEKQQEEEHVEEAIPEPVKGVSQVNGDEEAMAAEEPPEADSAGWEEATEERMEDLCQEELLEGSQDYNDEVVSWDGTKHENGSQDSHSTSPIPGSQSSGEISGGVKKPDINKHSSSKYNTVSYRKIRRGNTKQRIDEFESLMHA